jgi:predicted RNase H-like HicB family nuclease
MHGTNRHPRVASLRIQDYLGAMTHTYTIVLEAAEEGGFIVTVPALPDVGTQGNTRAKALANAREAIELVIEHRQTRREPIPADVSAKIERVTVAA